MVGIDEKYCEKFAPCNLSNMMSGSKILINFAFILILESKI